MIMESIIILHFFLNVLLVERIIHVSIIIIIIDCRTNNKLEIRWWWWWTCVNIDHNNDYLLTWYQFSWRKMLLSLICIEFIYLPSLTWVEKKWTLTNLHDIPVKTVIYDLSKFWISHQRSFNTHTKKMKKFIPDSDWRQNKIFLFKNKKKPIKRLYVK